MKTKLLILLVAAGSSIALADLVNVNFDNSTGLGGFGNIAPDSLLSLSGYQAVSVTNVTNSITKAATGPLNLALTHTGPDTVAVVNSGALQQLVFDYTETPSGAVDAGSGPFFTGKGGTLQLAFTPSSHSGSVWSGTFAGSDTGDISGSLISSLASGLKIQPTLSKGTVTFTFTGSLTLGSAIVSVGTVSVYNIDFISGTAGSGANTANVHNLQANSTITPEPATMSLFGVGLAAGALVLKRRRA